MLSLKESERVFAALGEGSRLRLLALCVEAEGAVGELALALGQSEPRVSRHLKILADCGLVVRRREGHRVCYRAVREGDAAELTRAVLARLDPADTLLRRDALRRVPPDGHGTDPRSPIESRLGRAMREFVGTGTVPGRALLLGLRHLELIESLEPRSRAATVVVRAPAAVRLTRSWIEARAAAECAVVELLPAGAEPWPAIFLDRAAVEPAPLAAALTEARPLLAAGGRLWLFERYDALEEAGEELGSHPLARLRRLLADRGLACERLQPLEAEGVHLLAARARAPGLAAS